MNKKIDNNQLPTFSPYMNKERYQQNQQPKTYHQFKQKTSSAYDEESINQQIWSPNNYEDQKQIRFPIDIQKKYSQAFDQQANTNALFHQLKRQSMNQIQAVQKLLTENTGYSGSKSLRIRKLDNLKLQKKEIQSRIEETKDDETRTQQIDSQNQLQEENSCEINQLKQKDVEIEELNRFIKLIGDEKSALNKQIEELQKKIKILNKNTEKLMADAQSKNDSISNLKKMIQSQDSELLEQKLKIEEQDKNLQTQNENISQANQEIQDKNNEIEELKYQIKQEIELKDCLNQQNLENEQLKEELRNLNQEKDNQNQIIQELKQQNENQSKNDQIIIDLQNELENMKTNLEIQNSEIQELTDASNQDIKKLNNQIKQQQKEMIDLKVELEVRKFGEGQITLEVKSFSTNLSQTFKMKLKDSISDLYIMAVQEGIHKGSPLDCCLLVPSKNTLFVPSEWNKKLYEIFIPSNYKETTITLEFCQPK